VEFVRDVRRRDVFEQLGDPGRDRRGMRGFRFSIVRLDVMIRAIVALFGFDALLIFQSVLVSASCHTVLLMM
jgi:hypothetical protein